MNATEHCIEALELLIIDLTNGYNSVPRDRERRQLVAQAMEWLYCRKREIETFKE